MEKITAIRFLSFVLSITMISSVIAISSINTVAASDNSQREAVTGVPSIHIETTNHNGNSIVKDDGYVDVSSIAIYDENGQENVSSENQGDQIKVRGNSTAKGKKKPFTFKLKNKTSVLGMKKNKKWCLLANCYDPTLLRNYIAFQIGQNMGLMVPDYKIVELTLDGQYKGCYLLTETTENAADIDTDLGEFFIEYEREREETETTYFTSDDLRFKADDPEYDDFQDTDFQYNGMSYETYIQSTLDNLMKILASGDYSQVKQNFDVESLAKYYLFNEYYKSIDVGYSSINFVYQDHKLAAGPVWDYDLSSGNYRSSNYKYDAQSYSGFCAQLQLFSKLIQYSQFCELVCLYYDQYKNIFQSYYVNNGIVDQATETYQDVFQLNFSSESNGAGWDVSKAYSALMRTPDSTYEENVNYYKSWLKNRNQWLSDHLYVITNKTYKLSTKVYTYNGRQKNPSLTIKDNYGKKIDSSSYKIEKEEGRTKVGSYTYTITFLGDYYGTHTVSFTIRPKATKITAIKKARKGFTVKWKKQKTQTTGYQICYSTSSKMKNAKYITVNGNTKTSYKKTKLKAKKKYYVRIRTYKKINSKKYYSAWSSKKSVKTY